MEYPGIRLDSLLADALRMMMVPGARPPLPGLQKIAPLIDLLATSPRSQGKRVSMKRMTPRLVQAVDTENSDSQYSLLVII